MFGSYGGNTYGDANATSYSATANSYANDGGYTAGSPGKSSQDNKSAASVQKLTPLLVKQVQSAVQVGDRFVVDGQELNQVTLVGTVKSVKKLSTNLTIGLQDPTGDIEVRKWLEDDDNVDRWREGMSVRVIGHLREFQEARNVLAFKIVPVEDETELEYHKLQATYVHLYNVHGPLPEDQGDTDLSNANAAGGANVYQSNYGATAAANTAAAGAGGQPSMQANAAGGGGNSLNQAVINAIKQVRGSQGAHISQIMSAVRHLASEQAIRSAIEWLSAEGEVYSTIDEEHFKTATEDNRT